MSEKNDCKWMVRVGCMTFNHASYIEDAMNGFTMQQTSFPFVCTIIDDASTDGEQEVIKGYLKEHFALEDKNIVRHEETDDYLLTFARHKTNLNCYFAVLFLKYNHYNINKPKLPYIAEWNDNTKYIALCEGDDYWETKDKLQKQLEYLEKSPQVGLVWSDINRFFEVEKRMEYCFFEKTNFPIKNTHIDFLLTPWFIAPCTWMYRSNLLKDLPCLDIKEYFTGDTLMILHFSTAAKIYYMDEVTAVYRVLPKSLSHFGDFEGKLNFYLKNKNTRIYFAKKQPLGFRVRFWKKITFEERFSFKEHPSYIFTWLRYLIRDFVVLIS